MIARVGFGIECVGVFVAGAGGTGVLLYGELWWLLALGLAIFVAGVAVETRGRR